MGDRIYFINIFPHEDEDRTSMLLYWMNMQASEIGLVRQFDHAFKLNESASLARIEMISVNNALYFPGILNQNEGYKLLKSGGTSETTVIVKDTYTPTLSSFPDQLVTIGTTTIFTAIQGEHTNLWRTDGTPTGTFMLREMHRVFDVEKVGDMVIVIGEFNDNQQIWKTDGTIAGTTILQHGYLGALSQTQIVDVYGTAYFSSADGELWKSNGTSAGTLILKILIRSTSLVKAEDEQFSVSPPSVVSTNSGEVVARPTAQQN